MDQLENLLDELRCWGNPTLYFSKYQNAWHCMVEMFVNNKGINFDIKSDYHSTPTEAVRECIRRVEAALNSLKTNAPALKG